MRRWQGHRSFLRLTGISIAAPQGIVRDRVFQIVELGEAYCLVSFVSFFLQSPNLFVYLSAISR